MRRIRLAFLGFALAACAAQAADLRSTSELVEVGARMYREGIMPSGEPLQAKLRGDVPVSQQQAACISCHRPSGMGSGEGQTVAPPVTGAALYRPREAVDRRLAYVAKRDARRPAYTNATLARALRDGVDAAGAPLADPMPRYALTDQELRPLIAYLKSLSPKMAPGVNTSEIHFATVVSDDVPPEQRAAMLGVFEAYLRDKNAGTRYETRRAERGPWTMKDYRAYRKWRLHVWELSGPRETWPDQLEAHYRQQPVFALLSGLASGPWQPIHEFCETHHVPCLFPNTDLPAITEPGFYSLYFSKGVTLEAETLAAWFQQSGVENPVVQVFDADAESAVAAQAFRTAMQQRDMAVQDAPFRPDTEPAGFWRELLHKQQHARVVLWLKSPDLNVLAPWEHAIDRVALSTLAPDGLPIPTSLRGKVVNIHPFVLPARRAQQLSRVRHWLRAKHISRSDERIQANAYFAATVAADGLMKIADIFSREYFIERIEDMMDDALTTSVYPRVSLGPGQRFVSKGAYVIEHSSSEEPLSPPRWIVP